MNVLLTNILQIFHVNLQELHPCLTTYNIVNVIATLSATFNILEMINICVQMMLNTVKETVSCHTYIHVLTIGNY